MARNRKSISKATSYAEIGEFWDTHDLADYWDQTKSVEFEVDLQSEITLFALDSHLSSRIRQMAARRGVLPETLLNLWVQEKLEDEAA